MNTSFHGGALVLAVATAVNSANAGPGGSPSALLDGFHAAIVVSLIVAVLGVAATRCAGPVAPSRARSRRRSLHRATSAAARTAGAGTAHRSGAVA